MMKLKKFEFLPYILLTSSNFLLVGDFGVQITSIRVVHHDTETALVHKRLFVGDNVGVSHRFEHVHLNQTHRVT